MVKVYWILVTTILAWGIFNVVSPSPPVLGPAQADHDQHKPSAIPTIAKQLTHAPEEDVQVQVKPTTGSDGTDQQVLIVNDDQFTMTLTGAMTMRIDTFETQVITYSSQSLTIFSAERGTSSFSSITTFATIQILSGQEVPELIVFTSSDNVSLDGACQVHVNEGENSAFYIQNLTRGTDVADVINTEIFLQVFTLRISGNSVVVTDKRNTRLISLTADSRKIELPLAEKLMYLGSSETLIVVNLSGKSYLFANISEFAIFKDNDLKHYNSSSEVSILLSNGGVLYINDAEKTALFASNSNPAVHMQLDSAASSVMRTYVYNIETIDGLHSLVVTEYIGSSPGAREVVQILTGAVIITIEVGHIIRYNEEEMVIHDTNDRVLLRLELIQRVVVNTNSISFALYMGSSSISFSGPGILSVNRGIAFFTTDSSLQKSIAFTVATAAVPVIHFEKIRVGFSVVDGVNHTIFEIVQTIGGNIVAVYEAESYDTSQEQVIVYEGFLVTVHQSITVNSGGISYTSAQQTVTYTNSAGVLQVLTNVQTLYVFNGGVIETFTNQTNFTLGVPGRLYVSQNGEEILFTASQIITSDVANLIRRLVAADFSTTADQFTSIVSEVFHISTSAALVTILGGGTIWSSAHNTTFYVDDDNVRVKTTQAVSTLFGITKSSQAKTSGIIRIIFNGRDIYSFLVVPGNRNIHISRTESFTYNGTTIFFPGGSYNGIHEVIGFDGMEVKEFDSPVEFDGPGLLLVQSGVDTAFFATFSSTVNYLVQSINLLRQYLVPPEVQQSKYSNVKISQRSALVDFGTDVRTFQGAHISFVCNIIAGRPQPNITFFKVDTNGVLLPLGTMYSKITVVNKTLTIPNIDIDDSGDYLCRADNSVPPPAEISSSLLVQEAVAPKITPGWIPLDRFITREQLLIWPTQFSVTHTINVQVVKELVALCLVEGRPKAEVVWLFNGVDIETALGLGVLENSSANITEVKQGRSILTIDVTANRVILSGENVIQCSAENAGGFTSGSVILQGIAYTCDLIGEGPCSRTCGIGIQVRRFACTREQGGMTVEIPVSEVPAEILPREELSQVCTPMDVFSRICPLTEYRWNVSEWSECSRTCGGGIRTRNVTCLNVSIPINSRYEAQRDLIVETEAEENMCVMFERAGEKPTEQELCETQRCPFWQTSKYSMCSVTCGRGVRTRSVTCNTIIGRFEDMNGKIQLNLRVENETKCNSNGRPHDTMACGEGRCHEWRVGQFHRCGDVALSDEFPFCKQREVFCSNIHSSGSKSEVNETFCASQRKPIFLSSCGGGRCFNGIWSSLPWNECSERCGYGTRSRVVQCHSPLSLTIVEEEFCDSSTMPPTESSCFVRNCDNTCLRDESPMCPIVARARMCGSDFAMGNNGLRCCVSCVGMAGSGGDHIRP